MGTICCLGHQGFFQYFDLSAGHEVNGPLRIRRIRMPSHASHSASTCSTFLGSTDLEQHDLEQHASTSTWTDAETSASPCRARAEPLSNGCAVGNGCMCED